MKVTDQTKKNFEALHDARERSDVFREAVQPFVAQRATPRIEHLMVSIVAAAGHQAIRAAAWRAHDDGTLVCTAATDGLVVEGRVHPSAEASDTVVARRLADVESWSVWVPRTMHNLTSEAPGEFDGMAVSVHFPGGLSIEVGSREASFSSTSYIALATFLAEALSVE